MSFRRNPGWGLLSGLLQLPYFLKSVCVSVCLCVRLHAYVYMWQSEDNLRCQSHEYSPLPLRHKLLLAWTHQLRKTVASDLKASPCLCFPSVGITPLTFFKTRSSCLWDKHLLSWAGPSASGLALSFERVKHAVCPCTGNVSWVELNEPERGKFASEGKDATGRWPMGISGGNQMSKISQVHSSLLTLDRNHHPLGIIQTLLRI